MTKRRNGYDRAAQREHALLDHVREAHSLKNDAELSRRAGLTPPTISKIRKGAPVSDTILVRLHETFGITFPCMRALMRKHEERAGAATA